MRKELALAGALVLVIVGAAFVLPEVSEARPAYEIPVRDAGSADNFENATAQGWSRTPSATVPLGTTGSAVPNADEISVESVEVEAARADGRLFVRLSWADGTRDDSTGAIRSFADAAALQFPVAEESRPPLAMGSTDNRVNVWYWDGTGTNEELLAGGPGTITSFDRPATNTSASYEDGEWHVVFSRPLDPEGANRTTVSSGQDLDVAVAVWNGSTLERSGQKGASEWYYLATGPGPEGPPYETILWVVAGIAIVLTTLVTIEGVRRTRGE